MNRAERRAHLGEVYGCTSGGGASDEFLGFVLAQMDANHDGNVSLAEFDGAYGPLDLGAWPEEKRCSHVPNASLWEARVVPHSFSAGIPGDADGAAFLQSRSSAEL